MAYFVRSEGLAIEDNTQTAAMAICLCYNGILNDGGILPLKDGMLIGKITKFCSFGDADKEEEMY